MSNHLKHKDTNEENNKNSPNVIIELSDNKNEKYINLSDNFNSMEILEKVEDDKNIFKERDNIFSKNPDLDYFSNLTFSQKFQKKYLTKKNIYVCIINISGILFYYFSLMSCKKSDPSECTIKYGLMFYVKIGILAFISSVLFSVYAAITIYYQSYLLHYLYVLPAYIYYFKNYQGTDANDHGFYNSLGWCAFSFILVIILLIFFKLYYFIKDKNYKTLITILVVAIAFVIYYNNLPGFSCDFWDTGLNNTKIHNDKNIYPCEILIPKKDKCYLPKLDGFLDFSKVLRPSCTSENILNEEKSILLHSLSDQYFGVSKLNHFGYPITTINEKYSMYSVGNLSEYQKLINRNMIKMDLYNKENYPDESYPEVEVIFDQNNHGRIKINITKNETLSSEKKRNSKEYT